MADTHRHHLIIVGERDPILGWHHAMRSLFADVGLPNKGISIRHSPLATAWWWDSLVMDADDEDARTALETLRQRAYSTPDVCGKLITINDGTGQVVDQTCFHVEHPLMAVAHKLLCFVDAAGEPLDWTAPWHLVHSVRRLTRKARPT